MTASKQIGEGTVSAEHVGHLVGTGLTRHTAADVCLEVSLCPGQM